MKQELETSLASDCSHLETNTQIEAQFDFSVVQMLACSQVTDTYALQNPEQVS